MSVARLWTSKSVEEGASREADGRAAREAVSNPVIENYRAEVEG